MLKKYYKKKIILIDRFTDSTVAYQHYGLGVNLSLIMKINEHLLNDFKIDFTFLNTVSNKNMVKRLLLRKKLNRYDKFKKDFYKKVQNGFIKIANTKIRKYKIIDSNLDIKINKKKILDKIEDLIK